MSSPAEICAYIEGRVLSVLLSVAKSRHYYDFSKNDDVRNKHIFAVLPGSGTPLATTTKTSTIQQDFQVRISREYEEKQNNDESLRAAIASLYDDGELILKAIKQARPSSIMIIGDPSFSEPEVDDAKKAASIVFTYPITYRKSIGS